MQISATELKNRLGRYLDAAETEPVIVEKSGRSKSVLISHELYQKYLALEDAFWAEQACQAEAEGYLTEGSVRAKVTKAAGKFLENFPLKQFRRVVLSVLKLRKTPNRTIPGSCSALTTIAAWIWGSIG